MSDEYERSLRIERVKELMADAAEFQRESFKNAGIASINRGLEEALQESGLTPQDWERIYYADPQVSLEKQKAGMKKFAKKLIAKAQKGQRAPDEKPSNSRESLRQGGQRPSSSDAKDLSSIAEAQRGGKMSSDKALSEMIKSTLGDYFSKTMGG